MRFGSTLKITKDSKSGITKTQVTKVRDYNEYVNETIHEERIQIIRMTDFDTIVQKLHIDHPLEDHGAWVEFKDGKMYAIKCWITRE